MAGSASDFLENKLIDHGFTGKTAYTKPVVYLALYTVAPTDAGGGTEVTGNAYARVATAGADWNAASGGATTNANTFTWPTPTGAGWGTIVAVGGLDASSGGNLLWVDSTITPRVGTAGIPVTIPASTLTVTLT
jgi:hypothetical protein